MRYLAVLIIAGLTTHGVHAHQPAACPVEPAAAVVEHHDCLPADPPIFRASVTPVASAERNDDVFERLVRQAYRYIGTAYRSGGSGKNGFDCSGFTAYLFAKFGLQIPRTSQTQLQVGLPVRKSELRKGDLVFFRGRNLRSQAVGHVGLVVSRPGEPVRFIHSSSGRGIVVDRLESEYYSLRFIAARRPVELTGQHDYQPTASIPTLASAR
jgi:cell wall-associated NlpC family hydrolase